jgi:Tetratricopeptide repeat
MRAVSLALRCILSLFAIHAAEAAQYLVVTQNPNGAWAFQAVESVSINGKDKVRAAALSAESTGGWDSKTIGHQAEHHLSDFTAVRRARDGTLLARGAGGDWQLLLPEGLKLKTAEPAAQLWSESEIELKKERKDKSPAEVRSQELYAIIPAQDAGDAAAELATDLSLYKLPGVTDADAFQQMVSLLPQAAKAFPAGSPADRMRSYVERAIAERLYTWRDGDAEVQVLEEASALAAASEVAFKDDTELAKLRAGVQSSRNWLDRRVAILRALDAGQQSDPFLLAYRDFENYDKSFQNLSKARLGHLNRSAAAHLETARQLRNRADYPGAVRHLLIAKWRSPKLAGTDELLEQVRLEAARLSSQRYAEARAAIDPRSAAQVQLQRKVLLAEQYLADGKYEDAEKALHEAEAIDADDPRLVLLYAKLCVARGELGRALALLDNYTGTAPTPQLLEEGERLRASVLYTIDKERSKTASQLSSALEQQRFGAALQSSAEGLKVDNESPQFLLSAGINACILRNCDKAAPLLRRYLDITDSTGADRKQRLIASRLLKDAEGEPAIESQAGKSGGPGAVS